MSATSSTRRRASNGAGVIDDFVDRHGERAVLATHRHREAIAHQERIDSADVEDSGERKSVRGQHRDRLPRSLHPREIRHPDFVLRGVCFQKIQPLPKKSRLPRVGNPALRAHSLERAQNHSESRSQKTDPGASRTLCFASAREALTSSKSRRKINLFSTEVIQLYRQSWRTGKADIFSWWLGSGWEGREESKSRPGGACRRARRSNRSSRRAQGCACGPGSRGSF